MNPQQIRDAVRDFLALVESSDGTAREAEERLVPILDRLALAQSYVSFEFDEADYPDSPNRSYDDLRKLVSLRFPNYGYYNVAEHITSDIGEASAIVGDAIDDLADIAGDLYKVEWYWANTSKANALFHLQQSYEDHWRRHLRGFQLYLDAVALDRDLAE